MPLLEFACRACGHRFESLVLSASRAARAKAPCPRCEARDTERQHSTFAAHASSATTAPAMAPGPCGSCGSPDGPGSCRT